MLKGIATLLFLALGCAALISATSLLTRDHIKANRLEAQQAQLRLLVGDKMLPAETDWQDNRFSLNCLILVRERVCGYGGELLLLVAIIPATTGRQNSPELSEVIVSHHRETPGITDFLGSPKFFSQLRGLDAAALEVMDTVTGATITSRALNAGLKKTLTETPTVSDDCL